MTEEFGDYLFVIANLARHLHIDPDNALRQANQKFISRFNYIEQALELSNITFAESNLAELDALWDEAKKIEQEKSNLSN